MLIYAVYVDSYLHSRCCLQAKQFLEYIDKTTEYAGTIQKGLSQI
jgi:hypothetical protein